MIDPIHRALETLRSELPADFQERVIRKVRSGEVAPIPRRARRLVLAGWAAALTLAALAWQLRVRPVDPDVSISIASDHARRALLLLEERVKGDRNPEDALKDLGVSGIAEQARRLRKLREEEIAPEVRSYVSEVLPRIEAAPSRGEAANLVKDAKLLAVARLRPPQGSRVDPVSDEDPERGSYLAARALLYGGEHSRAMSAFQEVLDRFPTGRFREGASYWLARSAIQAGRSREAAAAYYTLLGSSWLDPADQAVVDRVLQDLRSQSDDSAIRVLPPRGDRAMTLTIRQVARYLSEGRESVADVLVRPQIVTILLHSEWTVIQGDLDSRVVRAFQRIRSFYPGDVDVNAGPPAEVRLRVPAESSIRQDDALRKEVDVIRRAIPLLWR